MRSVRLIARLDIKAPNLIKTVNLEGVRVIGDPQIYAERYYREGIDEIIYLDAVASLYGRNHLSELLENTAKNIFVPITVGGGVRSAEDAQALLASGADKVAVNTAAVKRPELLSELAEMFGSQCAVLQIDAKKRKDGGWEAYCDGGREHTGLDVREWAVRGQSLGAGEILLTSIDCEGRREGFDIDLVRTVTGAVSIPVIASGGMGADAHLAQAVHEGGADAAAMAHVLHYQTLDISGMRAAAAAAGVPVREVRAA